MGKSTLLPAVCLDGDCVADAAGSWFNDQVTQFAEMMVSSLSQLSSDVATAWVTLPLMPTLGTWVGGGVCDPNTGECTDSVFIESAVFQFFRYELRWWSLALVTLGLLLTGLRIMWKQDGAELKEALKAILVYVALTSMGVATVFALISAGDKFSAHILEASTQEEFGEAIGRVLLLPAKVDGTSSFYTTDAVPVVLSILLLIFAVIVFVVQVVLLLVRGALLVVMVAMLPVAAAAGSTQLGKQMISKYLGWILALILYKPAAAVLYAAAFQLTTTSADESVLTVLSGITIFLAALFMLPALLRLIVPATSAVASGAGAGGLAMAGAGAGLATGAVAVKSLGTGGAGAAASAGSMASRGGSGGGPAGSKLASGGGGGGGPAGAKAASSGGGGAGSSSGPKGAKPSPVGGGKSGESSGGAGGKSPAGEGGSESGPSGSKSGGSSAGSMPPPTGSPGGGGDESGPEGGSSGGQSGSEAGSESGPPGGKSGGSSAGSMPPPTGSPGGGGDESGSDTGPSGGKATVGSSGSMNGAGPPQGGAEPGAGDPSGPAGAEPVERSNPWTSGPSGGPRPRNGGYGSAAARGAGAGKRAADQVKDVADESGEGPAGAQR